MADETPKYPTEPVPSRDKLKDSIAKLFQEIGTANLTRRVLTKRLTIEFEIDFSAHRKLLDELVMEQMQEPEMKKQVAKAAKKHQEGPSRGTKAKAKKDKDGKEKKGKREKEEGEPTRAQSAFFFFSNEKRPAILAAQRSEGDGKVDIGAVGKKIGEMWSALSADEKQPYEAKAAEDKARYQKEKDAWIAAGGGSKKDKAAAKEGPKRPMNSSFMYVNANREAYKQENPDAKLPEVTKALSERFKNLSPDEKKVWDDKAAADKARYEKEMAEFKAKN